MSETENCRRFRRGIIVTLGVLVAYMGLGASGSSAAPEAVTPCLAPSGLDLNERYSEMGQRAATDFDERRTHSNEILNIWETNDIQIYYQEDKDWFYRAEERRWLTMNDNSSWRRIERRNGKVEKSLLHIA